jgi:hypothetical protein
MMKCRGKSTYDTKEIADNALQSIRKSRHKREHTPVRSYRCEHCNKFHLTSKEEVAVPAKLKHEQEFKKYLG